MRKRTYNGYHYLQMYRVIVCSLVLLFLTTTFGFSQATDRTELVRTAVMPLDVAPEIPEKLSMMGLVSLSPGNFSNYFVEPLVERLSMKPIYQVAQAAITFTALKKTPEYSEHRSLYKDFDYFIFGDMESEQSTPPKVILHMHVYRVATDEIIYTYTDDILQVSDDADRIEKLKSRSFDALEENYFAFIKMNDLWQYNLKPTFFWATDADAHSYSLYIVQPYYSENQPVRYGNLQQLYSGRANQYQLETPLPPGEYFYYLKIHKYGDTYQTPYIPFTLIPLEQPTMTFQPEAETFNRLPRFIYAYQKDIHGYKLFINDELVLDSMATIYDQPEAMPFGEYTYELKAYNNYQEVSAGKQTINLRELEAPSLFSELVLTYDYRPIIVCTDVYGAEYYNFYLDGELVDKSWENAFQPEEDLSVGNHTVAFESVNDFQSAKSEEFTFEVKALPKPNLTSKPEEESYITKPEFSFECEGATDFIIWLDEVKYHEGKFHEGKDHEGKDAFYVPDTPISFGPHSGYIEAFNEYQKEKSDPFYFNILELQKPQILNLPLEQNFIKDVEFTFKTVEGATNYKIFFRKRVETSQESENSGTRAAENDEEPSNADADSDDEDDDDDEDEGSSETVEGSTMSFELVATTTDNYYLHERVEEEGYYEFYVEAYHPYQRKLSDVKTIHLKQAHIQLGPFFDGNYSFSNNNQSNMAFAGRVGVFIEFYPLSFLAFQLGIHSTASLYKIGIVNNYMYEDTQLFLNSLGVPIFFKIAMIEMRNDEKLNVNRLILSFPVGVVLNYQMFSAMMSGGIVEDYNTSITRFSATPSFGAELQIYLARTKDIRLGLYYDMILSTITKEGKFVTSTTGKTIQDHRVRFEFGMAFAKF